MSVGGGNVSHDWILSSDWATVSSAAGQQLNTQLTRPFLLVQKWAGSWVIS